MGGNAHISSAIRSPCLLCLSAGTVRQSVDSSRQVVGNGDDYRSGGHMTMLAKRLAVAIVAVTAMASAARAQELIANGEFDVGVAGWARYGAGSEPMFILFGDRDECASSGAAEFAGNTLDQDNWMRTCVTGLSPLSAYSLAGNVRFISSTTDSVLLGIEWHDSTADCLGAIVGGFATTDTLFADGNNAWTLLSNSSIVSPASARSAYVSLLLQTPSFGLAVVRVDGVHLGPGHGYLFGDGYESGSLCRWSSASPA